MMRFSEQKSRHFAGSGGFSLIELLTVLAITAILAVLIAPSIPSLFGARSLTSASYDLAGQIERARTYAMANNTYVWVGLFEEDGSQPSQKPAVSGIGRVVLYTVASQDGTRYSDATINTSLPAAFGVSDSSNLVQLTQVNKIVKYDGLHLVANNAGQVPVRPLVPAAYQVGDAAGSMPNNSGGPFALHVGAAGINPTVFTYPLSAGAGAQYTFSKIIEFNRRGEASKIDENVFSGPGPQNAIEIALQPTHGNVVAANFSGANQNQAAVVIQIEGLSGQVGIVRL